MPSDFWPDALHELQTATSLGGTRRRRPARASRDLSEPEPVAITKERAHKANSLRLQEYQLLFLAVAELCVRTATARSVLVRYAFASSAKLPRSHSITTRAAASRLK